MQTPSLDITALYAAALGIVLVVLSYRVISARMAAEVSLGDGGMDAILVAQRAHGNFIEYVPMALLLIGILEIQGSPAWLVHGLGAALLIARIAHPFGIASEFKVRPARAAGATITLIVLAVASIACLWGAVA